VIGSIVSAKEGEKSRSFDSARHPLREEGRDLFLASEFRGEIAALDPDPRRLLVLGSGDGKEAAALRNHFPRAQVISLDLSEAEIAQGGANLPLRGHLVRGDWDCLPFRAKCFDGAVFFAALHHSQDLAATLSELALALRPGGFVYATHEPLASLLWGKRQRARMAEIGREEGGIETSPSAREYREGFRRAGFEDLRISSCALNWIRLMEMDQGFVDVLQRRSDWPERGMRRLVRLFRPLGRGFNSNLIFWVQKLALGLFGVTLSARLPRPSAERTLGETPRGEANSANV
jgi:SAM-dependent methyltransferase